MKELLFDSSYYKMFLKETENVHGIMLYIKKELFSSNSDDWANVSNVLI